MTDTKKYIQLLVDKIENLNRHAVCHMHEDIPKEIYDFLREDGSKKTNFEKITESTQALAEVIKDSQEIYFCGNCPAFNFCRDISGMNSVECYEMIEKWLKQEVEE